MARAFNKKVKPREINEGDLVLRARLPSFKNPLMKWGPKWIGPYVVKKILSGGAAKLIDMDGYAYPQTVNLDQLKKYYA